MDFEMLIKKLMPKLKAISRKVNIRYTYCDEDDFMQEALIYMWEAYRRGELNGKTDSYILQGTYYFLKNYVRKKSKALDRASISMNCEIDDTGKKVEDTLTLSENTTGIDGSVEIFMLLEEAEEKFTEKEKEVFYYRIEGYTAREIGSKLGVSHVMVVKIAKSIRVKCRVIREELISS